MFVNSFVDCGVLTACDMHRLGQSLAMLSIKFEYKNGVMSNVQGQKKNLVSSVQCLRTLSFFNHCILLKKFF